MADDNKEVLPDNESFDFLVITKMLLGIEDKDTSQDKILHVYIDITKQSILNYCNISELPSALFYTTCEIVADTYTEYKGKNKTSSIVGNVSSISEDGRTVSFSNGSELKRSLDDKISKRTELNRYKKLYRV